MIISDYKREAEGHWTTEEGNITLKQDVAICAAGLEDGGRGHTPRNKRNAALEAGKVKESYSSVSGGSSALLTA